METNTFNEVSEVGQKDNNTEKKVNKHISYEERIKIEALNKTGINALGIGKQIRNKDRRTIERELALGKIELLNSDLTKRIEYSADVAQTERDKRSSNKGPMLKIGKDHKLVAYLEKRIGTGKEQVSPYAALENIKNKELKFATEICCKTVYNYLDMGLFLNISNKDLPIKTKSKKRNYKRIRQAIINITGTSTSERPLEIEQCIETGHWEMDTVVGKQGTKTVLLVLSERVTRQELIFKIKSKSQSEVIRIIDKLEREYKRNFKESFKTITCDNGCEFLDHEGIEKSIKGEAKRTKIYFAHPYSSWQRGTNENINKMIRRFIPKGVDINAFGDKEIKRIQNWINNYPRKIFGGLSSNMMVEKLKSVYTIS